MWTRGSLKEKAKSALSANYWRTIAVTLIVFLIGGASSTVGYSIESDKITSFFQNGTILGTSEKGTTLDEFNFNSNFYYDDTDYEDYEFYKDFKNFEEFEDFENYKNDDDLSQYDEMIFGMLLMVILVIAVVGGIIGLILSVFISNPLEVGTKRFLVKNLNKPAEMKEVAFAFDNSYKNVIKILFFRNLYICGWTLLLVVPGIVKSYEYLMVPYLLAENPNLTKEDAFRLSKEMMMGHKWDAFVLGLSFIGWDILGAFTGGILAVFYVQPYKCLTYAALYEELSLINGRPATGFYHNEYAEINPYENVMSSMQEEI